MTRDELLDAYEDLWRGNALRGVGQWRGIESPTHTRNDAGCAWLTPKYQSMGGAEDLVRAAQMRFARWDCPECGATLGLLSNIMAHLNDAPHRWTWDMFAGKFRDVLQRGEAGAAGDA